MTGLNANVGYVVIPNAGIDPDALRGIKRTVPKHGLYVVRLTEFAVSLQVWYDIASTGMVDTGILIEKGHNFLQVLEPIFDEFLAIAQKLEQRDKQDFKYRQNRYKSLTEINWMFSQQNSTKIGRYFLEIFLDPRFVS
jgi:UTP-glucose-1-phosphate uridylyltransferase